MTAKTRGTRRRRSTTGAPPTPRRVGPLPLWAAAAAAAMVLAVVGIATLNSLTGTDTAPAGSSEYAVGDPGPGEPAPDFTLPSTAGDVYRLSAQRGETVLLYFHEGLMCAPCWQQVTDIQRDLAQFEALGVDQIVPISIDPIAAQAQHAAQQGITLPALADEDKSVSSAYDALSYGMMGGQTPGHTFILVGPDGQITWRADYGGTPNYTMHVPNEALLADLRQAIVAN